MINFVAISCGSEKPEESLNMPMPLQEATVELNCLNPLSGLAFSLTFNILLVAACSYYAFKTRCLPDNFNESRCIVLCIYTTFIIWLVSVPSYLTTTRAYHQSIVLAAALLLNPSVALMTLYVPKIYALTYMHRFNGGYRRRKRTFGGALKSKESNGKVKNMINKVSDNTRNQLSIRNFDHLDIKTLECYNLTDNVKSLWNGPSYLVGHESSLKELAMKSKLRVIDEENSDV